MLPDQSQRVSLQHMVGYIEEWGLSQRTFYLGSILAMVA